MSLSDRDKKLMIFILPIAVLAAFWFLMLSPKRDEAAQAEQDAIAQQDRRDQAEAQLSQANAAQTDFAADYGEIVRLGKAIPAQVDMPSLLVQLEAAAEGTGIHFTKIATGDRTETLAAAPPPATPPAGESTGGTTPADAGGAPAQSAPGTAAEAANTAAATSEQRSSAAEQSGVDPADAQTSTSTGQGLPVGGGSAAPAGSAPAATSPVGLETVPLELEFVGDFFNLADFFHDVKRFVRVAGTNVVVGGRLITIESINYSSDQSVFPAIKAELNATIYLSPKVEGATAGATPEGPPATTPASTPTEPADPGPSAPTPTAVATP
jgi:Tfp pilus assembly protein PilO